MLDKATFLSQYKRIKATALKHRYVTNTHIEPLLKALPSQFNQTVLGTSEAGRPIHGLQIGKGTKRVFMWSQMHGNESTTTKALFDLFNYFKYEDCKGLLESCTLFIIPILNPDGAEAYTRLNANKIDLNRDAINQSQSESRVLRTVYENFKPHFCFNLHGQRTIFSAGKSDNSSVISFLSPSENIERSLSETRQKSMELIDVMNQALQPYLPNQIGRYDDEFNDNCVGDYFQSQGTPTVLFEAGHFPNDYSREHTRKYMTLSLMSALDYVANCKVSGKNYKRYFEIPENKKLFYDVIVRNAVLNSLEPHKTYDLGIQHTEVLVSGQVEFKPKILFIGDLSEKYGHLEIDALCKRVSHQQFEILTKNCEMDTLLINFIEISLFSNNNLMLG